MEKERESRGRVLKKNGTRFFPSSPSPSPSGSNINCNGGGDVNAMESCRKERAKGLKGSSDNKEDCMMDECNGGGSEGEEGNIFRLPLNTNGSSSRKRIKLQGKASDDRGPERPVEPPLVVPKAAKRLRSAINKRTSQSASPPLSDSKRGHQHAHNGTQLFNRSNREKFKQKMLEEPSKDEEEVAETLISIASLITISEPLKTKEDGKVLQENSETETNLASLLEAPKEECTKILVPCNGTSVINSIPSADDLSRLEQPIGASASLKIDVGGNEAAQLKPPVALPSNAEPVEGVTPSTDPQGTPLQYFPQNGMLQPKQLDAHLLRKQELGTTSMGCDKHSFNLKPECGASDVGLKDPFLATTSSLQPGLLAKGHEKLAMQPSNKDVAYPNLIVVSGRPGIINGLPNEKLFLSPADKEQQWNRCRTHVRICHLIKTHKKAGKKQLFESKENHLKAKEGTHQNVPTSSEINESNNMLEVRNQMLHNARHLQAQQAARLSGFYALQKQVGDTKTSRNEKKSEQFPAAYPPNQVYTPFTCSQGSYSQYQEWLAAGPSQQAQLRLPPPYLATSHLYGPHMGHAAAAVAAASTTTKQQQQLMWQAHLAHYRPPIGVPTNWQQGNGRPHDSSSSSSSLVNQPPSIFPLPADFNPQNLHQAFILPWHSPSASLPIKSNQNPQSSAHLQMISNAESFR